jgi:urease accessory protein
MLQVRFLAGLVGMITSGAALAHTGAHAGGGWVAGFAHPFMGVDHVLAMVALGVWANQLSGHYRLLLPAVFVAAMAAGAAAAAQGIVLPQVESMLALSVLVLGILAALAVKTQWHWPVSLVALFAMFHGHAHIAEMPVLATPWLYFAGLLAAAACLLALGAAAATALQARPHILRAGGAAIGIAGTGLLFAAIA